MHWQAAEAWNKASEEEKAPHVAAAAREKKQYERLCDEYTEKKDAATAAAAMNRAKDLLSCLGSDRHSQVALCWHMQHSISICYAALADGCKPLQAFHLIIWSSHRLLVVYCSKLVYTDRDYTVHRLL